MANSSAVTLDEVVISIQSNTSSANKNISDLSATLRDLKTNTQGGFNNINQLAQYLNNLKVASEGFRAVYQNISGLKGITNSLAQLSEIKTPTGLGNTINALERLPEIFNKIDPKTLDNVSRVSNKLADALTPLANKMADIGNGFSKMQMLADRYGVSVTKIRDYTKQSSNSFDRLKKSMSSVVSATFKTSKAFTSFMKINTRPLEKLTSKIKQIGLSLLGTRTIFTLTRKAVSEYMAMDQQLTDQIQNTWRALGAQLAPAIEYVMYLFKQFVRVIYSIILALTGIDLISRANEKAMQAWGKSAKSTLGNLQKFDDLNVVEFPSSGAGDNKLIELDTIDLSPIQKVIDWVRKLRDEIKDAWNSGQWEGVGKVLAEGINSAMKALDFAEMQNKLNKIAENFGDLLKGAINEFEWDTFGTKLTSALKILPDTISKLLDEVPWTGIGIGLKETIHNLDLASVVDSIFKPMKSLVEGISKVLKEQDFSEIGTKIYDAVKTAFKDINGILDAIPWKDIGTYIKEQISKIKWKDIFEIIETTLGNIFKGLSEFLSGLTGMDEETASTWILPLIVGIPILLKSLPKLIKLLFSGKKAVSGVSDVSSVFNISKVASIAVTLGGLALVIKELTEFLKVFSETSLTAKDAVGLLVTMFLGISVAVMAMSTAFSMMDWTSIVAGIVVLGGLALIINQLTGLLNAFSKSGLSLGEALGFLGGTLGIVVVAMGVMVALSKVLSSDPLALLGVLALVGAISVILLVMKETLPTILESCSKFIKEVSPPIIDILNTIKNVIVDIIDALSNGLVNAINAVGGVFDKIFNGIANVVSTVGNVIVNILREIGRLVDTVLKSLLNFINDLGPATNNLVDNMISAITKLINFVVSGVEYLINTAIINPINSLINKLNSNAIAEKLGWQLSNIGRVNIERFTPKLETGTNEVPYEGLYHLHPGEAVVPKKYNPALGGGTNSETNERLDRLIYIMENMNFTNIVNVGNETLYKKQQSYNKQQNNKYGTINL